MLRQHVQVRFRKTFINAWDVHLITLRVIFIRCPSGLSSEFEVWVWLLNSPYIFTTPHKHPWLTSWSSNYVLSSRRKYNRRTRDTAPLDGQRGSVMAPFWSRQVLWPKSIFVYIFILISTDGRRKQGQRIELYTPRYKWWYVRVKMYIKPLPYFGAHFVRTSKFLLERVVLMKTNKVVYNLLQMIAVHHTKR